MTATLAHAAAALALFVAQPGDTRPAPESPAENPIELGRIQWERDWPAAAERARKLELDVLLLFQEVPG